MAIAYRNAATASVSNAKTISVTDPSTAGDCLLAAVECDGGGQTLAAPDGSWIQIGFGSLFTDNATWSIWYKKVSAGTGTLTFSSPNALNMGLLVAAWSGVDATTPLQVTPVSETHDDGRASPASVIAPTLTTTANGCQIVWVGIGDPNNPSPASITFTPPSGYTSRVGFADSSGWDVICVADKAQGTAGATGAATGTFTRASTNFGVIGWHIALAAAAGGGGGTTVDVDGGTDTPAVTDSGARSAEYGRAGSETVSTSDGAAGASEFGRAPSEAVSATDSAILGIEFGRTGSDTASTSDAASAIFEYGRALADTASTSDAVTFGIEFDRALSDTADLSDFILVEEIYEGANEDSVSATDSAILGIEFGRAPSETVSASDASTLVIEYGRSAVESVSTSDAATGEVITPSIIEVQVGETVSSSDAIGQEADYVRAGSDSVVVTDSSALGRELARTASDAAVATDALLSVADYVRSSSDAVAALDAADAAVAIPSIITVGVSDTVLATDAATDSADYGRMVSETALATDGAALGLEAARTVLDALTALDALAAQLAAGRAANDTLATDDALLVEVIVPAVIVVTASDASVASDALISEADYGRALLTDALALRDEAAAERITPGNPPVPPRRRGPVMDARDSSRRGPIKRLVERLREAA